MTEQVSVFLPHRETMAGVNRQAETEKADHEPAAPNKPCRLPR